VKEYSEAMKKYAPGASQNEWSLNTWLAYMGFRQVVGQIQGEITRESVLEQLEKTTTLNLGGLVPKSVVYWGEGEAPNPQFPRVRDVYSTWPTVKGGQFTWDGVFHGGLGAPTKTAR
jgi:hypothetical protein